ncbi:NfeD family protein [Vallitalea sp.]|jgi:membrane protein implicated in regulation of membrane protease activity|uniref:NfeD family protein n=1 Tax=Vallitalea sp. TaxID=1882829 RepID=UPI0025DA66AD|nr:NfeD family protein [Vallitalea sp.]MCT4686457.1 NfeD family protein [Vallitalea sp.]
MPEPYLIWLGVLIICIILEAATLGLTTIWFAFGALASLLVSLFGAEIITQVLVFIIVSLCLLYFTRPIALKVLKIGHAKTNYESIIGKEGIVIEDINNLSAKGQVKVDGQIWSCRSLHGSSIEKGMKVKVAEVKGVKLIVEKVK